MRALDLDRRLRDLHAVPEGVDGIVAGDAATEVHGVAVCWMPTWDALREAYALGCNVVVAHEPAFYAHLDATGEDPMLGELPPRAAAAVAETRAAKRAWIEEHGMVVIRCHDVLDLMPGGIVDSFAEALGFGGADVLVAEPQRRVLRVDPAIPAGVLAERLTAALAALGQPGAAFAGDPDRVVASLGIGTGYDCAPWTFVELEADMCITIDDRIRTWIEPAWADDAGYPMLVVHHGVTEEPGCRALADRIAAALPALPVRFLPQGFRARWVRA